MSGSVTLRPAAVAFRREGHPASQIYAPCRLATVSVIHVFFAGRPDASAVPLTSLEGALIHNAVAQRQLARALRQLLRPVRLGQVELAPAGVADVGGAIGLDAASQRDLRAVVLLVGCQLHRYRCLRGPGGGGTTTRSATTCSRRPWRQMVSCSWARESKSFPGW